MNVELISQSSSPRALFTDKLGARVPHPTASHGDPLEPVSRRDPLNHAGRPSTFVCCRTPPATARPSDITDVTLRHSGFD